MKAYEQILFQKENGRAYITFNRAEKLNAITPRLAKEFVDAIENAESDDKVRVIIVTGAGAAFCAGADLGEMIPLITSGSSEIIDLVGKMVLKHMIIKKPIIAAVNGNCVAGGTELLQATDIRIASEEANFGLPEPRWGIVPMGGSHVRLPRQIPYCHAMELLLTGEMIDAYEALRIGLINRVVPSEKVLAVSEEYAEKICSKAPLAIASIKETVIRCLSSPMEEAFYLEEALSYKVLKSEDAQEGPRAFIEKRAPSFKGH